MQETLIHPPRTMMEVFKMLPQGTLAEIINNRLYVSPGPIGKHQRLVTSLTLEIGAFVKSRNLGEIFVAPFDVFLDEEENAVQPDLIFVSTSNSNIIDDNGVIHGIPDILIEILSPGNPAHDTVIKKNLYERFGVKEYWIIDPSNKVTIGYTLDKNVYKRIDSKPGQVDSKVIGHSFVF